MVKPSQVKKSLKAINGHSFILSRVMRLGAPLVFLTAHVQHSILIKEKLRTKEPKFHCSNNVSTFLINKITEKVD